MLCNASSLHCAKFSNHAADVLCKNPLIMSDGEDPLVKCWHFSTLRVTLTVGTNHAIVYA